MTQDEPRTRRRRRRATSAAGPPPPPASPAAAAAPSAPSSRSARPRRRDDTERGSRDLAGAGPSRLGVGGALRARDVNRPTDDDLAEAERELQLVRRHWKPTS